MDSPYARELEIALPTLQQASILAHSIIADHDKGVVQKTDAEAALSPVTVADFAVQALLSATFRGHFPSDGLVGEESADELRRNEALLGRVWGLLEEARARVGGGGGEGLVRVPGDRQQVCELMDACGRGSPGRGRVWVFDPIDGTKGYMAGEMYAINVALLEDGRQVFGAVACPHLDPDASGPINDKSTDASGRGSLLFAARGHGAYIRPLHAEGEVTPRKLDPHPADPTLADLKLATCTLAPASGSLAFHQSAASALGMAYPGCDLLPWVVRWVALAMGLANTTIWVYNSPKRRGKIWDHAGAMLLFEEVGGRITDVNGRGIDFGAGRSMEGNFGFVASLEGIHGRVLEGVRGIMRQFGRADVLE